MKVPFAQFSLLCLLLAAFNAGAGEVRIVTNAAGEHTLLRDAVPYTVRGACCPVETTVGELVAAGGNSVRTYGKEIERILPMARKYNLSIMLGLPIKRERDGFNYEDSAAVEAQFLEMREWVRRYRNEPNLLMWAIGNEPELAARNTVPLWREVNRLARMIREEDSRHPIITVLAGFDERKIREVLKHCPELDALGINDYGPAKDWPDELRRYGWIKPYLHTEFGPLGYWPGPHNRPPTAWGAAVEQTSSEKAELYA
ncbi:MAG: glycoside hydrolase family 2 TIM barrel-domain containing protein, partial [Luteolibacter sp.]